jgi:hypothetical protein
MAITKEVRCDKIEVVGDYKAVQCREATIIKEDGVELSRSFQRHVLHPSICITNEAGEVSHLETDISGEPAETQAICNAVWTDEIRSAWKSYEESQQEDLTK